MYDMIAIIELFLIHVTDISFQPSLSNAHSTVFLYYLLSQSFKHKFTQPQLIKKQNWKLTNNDIVGNCFIFYDISRPIYNTDH